MTATIINGRAHADLVKNTLKSTITAQNLKVGLAVILVGDNPASQIYVERKKQACAAVGITGQIHALNAKSSSDDVLNLIRTLNDDGDVHGILLQLPLPDHLDATPLIGAIAPHKDVDGLTPVNMGHLMSGHPRLVPCTPQGVMELLMAQCADLTGKHAVIIGRSLLFGKPMGQLLLNADCTVTHCHSKTVDLPTITRQADILIAATGQAKMVKADWVKKDAIVIDVGISRTDDNTISGDVDFDAVSSIASAITPVPGGVGPMTVACLLKNTVKAAQLS